MIKTIPLQSQSSTNTETNTIHHDTNSPTQPRRQFTQWSTILGIILTITITGGGVFVAWGYNKADIGKEVSKDKAAQATVETKIDNIEKAIADIKAAQQKILDLLINAQKR